MAADTLKLHDATPHHRENTLNMLKIDVDSASKAPNTTQPIQAPTLPSQGNASKEENGAEASPLPGASLGFSPGNWGDGGAGKMRNLNDAFRKGAAQERRRRCGRRSNRGFPRPSKSTAKQHSSEQEEPLPHPEAMDFHQAQATEAATRHNHLRLPPRQSSGHDKQDQHQQLPPTGEVGAAHLPRAAAPTSKTPSRQSKGVTRKPKIATGDQQTGEARAGGGSGGALSSNYRGEPAPASSPEPQLPAQRRRAAVDTG